MRSTRHGSGTGSNTSGILIVGKTNIGSLKLRGPAALKNRLAHFQHPTENICALFVLLGTLENSGDPKLLANTAKHFAFIHCGESNLFGMVDAQLAAIECELLRANELIS